MDIYDLMPQVKQVIKEEEEDKVEVSLEKYPAELAENLKISNLEVIIINLIQKLQCLQI